MSMWSGESSAKSKGGIGSENVRATLFTFFFLFWTPLTSIIISRTVFSTAHDGSFFSNVFEICADIWKIGAFKACFRDAFDPFVWKVIAVYMTVQLLLMRFMPGETYKGPHSPNGNYPIYKDNCFRCYVASFVLFIGSVHLGLFNGGIMFDIFPQFIASMNVFALTFCLLLLIKGFYAPSSTDSGSSGNILFDYYWGVELYPRILGIDVKVFTNCRYGMTGWALLCLSFCYAQYEKLGYVSDAIIISTILQIVYLAKFHIWERGYMFTIDIMHDRAGFYICWGCLVWVPSLYTAHTAFLVLHPANFPIWATVAQLVFGLVSIYLNYDIDRQRQEFRATNGKQKIWGKEPQYLEATYNTTSNGKVEVHTSKLLYSGWWGVSRKINYFFELCAALSWSVVFANHDYFTPYFYFIFLLILLVDRAWRDDARCRAKYGAQWDEYCKKVPYLIIPGIY